MKKISFLLFVLFIGHFAIAQRDSKKAMPVVGIDKIAKKSPCDSIVVDFNKGMINGKLEIASPLDSIKKYFPCVTKVIPSGEEEGVCGGGIFLEKQGVMFNPDKGFIEFSEETTAKLPIHVFGISEDSLNASMTGLAQVSDISPSTADHATHSIYLYPKTYGCLAIWVDVAQKKVMKIQMHNKNFAKAFLCVE